MKNKETFVGFTRSLVHGCCPDNMEGWTQNGEWYENFPPGDENPLSKQEGKQNCTPNRSNMETLETTNEAMTIRRLNEEVDTLLEMASQKVLFPSVTENHQVHRRIGTMLTKWRSEKLVRIHPREVEALTIYQNQLLWRMDEQRADKAMERICGGFQVQLDETAEAVEKVVPVAPIGLEGWKKN